MKPTRLRHRRSLALIATLALSGGLLLLPGCNSILVPKHKVLIDSICAPDATKPAGKSYRLVAKRSMVTQSSVPVVKACVDAAFASVGMFEPPANVPPDLFVEVSFGRESAPRADAATRETFLQLAARTNPELSNDRATGTEIWDIKVAVLGVAGPLESAMPLLAAVAANNLASDTRVETKLEIPQNSPMVEAVRLAAIKLLESKDGGASNQSAAPATGAPAAAPSPKGASPAPSTSTAR